MGVIYFQQSLTKLAIKNFTKAALLINVNNEEERLFLDLCFCQLDLCRLEDILIYNVPSLMGATKNFKEDIKKLKEIDLEPVLCSDSQDYSSI